MQDAAQEAEASSHVDEERMLNYGSGRYEQKEGEHQRERWVQALGNARTRRREQVRAQGCEKALAQWGAQAQALGHEQGQGSGRARQEAQENSPWLGARFSLTGFYRFHSIVFYKVFLGIYTYIYIYTN